MKKFIAVLITSVLLMSMASVVSAADVTLEFQQWWGVELPPGELQDIVDGFTEKTGIKIVLLSNPYADTNTQIAAGAATGTMADVVGLDGSWVYDYAKMGAISNLTQLMKESGYDDSQLTDQIRIDGDTYMIPVVNFAYPMFVNRDLVQAANLGELPKTRSEFVEAAKAVVDATDAYGWIIPLSTSTPSGAQNQFMSWLWASGGSMLADGQPNLVGNKAMEETVEFVKGLFDNNLVSPGAYSMTEPTMVEEFVNGRVAFMTSSLAHLYLIKDSAPTLNLDVMAVPSADGYTGERGMVVANWGIGIARNSKHQTEAMQFVQYMMSPEVNARLAKAANAFPGNKFASPDYSDAEPLFVKAYEIFMDSYAVNEFTGLPTSEHLMRAFNEHFMLHIEGDIDLQEMLSGTQDEWERAF